MEQQGPPDEPAAKPRDEPRVLVRYWAGARAAAGVDVDTVVASTVGAAIDEAVRRHPTLEPVTRVATVLVAGMASPTSRALVDGDTVEVLPPFAGG